MEVDSVAQPGMDENHQAPNDPKPLTSGTKRKEPFPSKEAQQQPVITRNTRARVAAGTTGTSTISSIRGRIIMGRAVQGTHLVHREENGQWVPHVVTGVALQQHQQQAVVGAQPAAQPAQARPVSDLKVKLGEAEAIISRLQTQIQAMEGTRQAAAVAPAPVPAAAAPVTATTTTTTTTPAAAPAPEVAVVPAVVQQELDKARSMVQSITDTNKTLRGELTAALSKQAELEVLHAEVSSRVAETDARATALEAEVGALRAQLQAAEECVKTKDEEIQWLQNEVDNGQREIDGLRRKAIADEALRRKLHNTVLELKGNIRVFCRVRPLSDKEREAEAAATANGAGPSNQILFPAEGDGRRIDLVARNTAPRPGRGKVEKEEWSYNFDRVFPPESSQAQVFDEISGLVQSALDGYRVCVFAYGQTGSGKTYTMEGAMDDESNRGVIPRAVEQIFASTRGLEAQGWNFKLTASYLEIYNEQIFDLLTPGGGALELRAERSGEVHVAGLSMEVVDELKAVSKLIARARRARSTGKTNCNEHSSRSHSLFQLRIDGSNPRTGEPEIHGLLNLIDLAGSERLKESGAEGARLKETQSINTSLSALSGVIQALANKEQHVPYRNSQLTRILQNSLGREAKMLMFVNVNPSASALHETNCSLKFAERVNSCDIGRATRSTGKVKLND